MRSIALFVALIAAMGIACAAGIKWQKDYNKAVQLAKKLKKPIMIDFYADW